MMPGGKAKNAETADACVSRMLATGYVKDFYQSLIAEITGYSLESGCVTVPYDIWSSVLDITGCKEDAVEFVVEAVQNRVVAVERGLEALKRNRVSPTSSAMYAVLERAGFKCQACGAKPSKDHDVELEVDHILPFSLGGTNTLSNYQALCKQCNASKGNRFFINHNEDF